VLEFDITLIELIVVVLDSRSSLLPPVDIELGHADWEVTAIDTSDSSSTARAIVFRPCEASRAIFVRLSKDDGDYVLA
jgi:hypothetical protein